MNLDINIPSCQYYLKEATTYLSCTELCFDSGEEAYYQETSSNQNMRYIWKKEAAELCWFGWLEITSSYFDNEIRKHLNTIITDFIRVTIKRQKRKEDHHLLVNLFRYNPADHRKFIIFYIFRRYQRQRQSAD